MPEEAMTTTPSPTPGATRTGRQLAARVALSGALLAVGLYILSNYIRALVWALVLAIALWPLFARAAPANVGKRRQELIAAAFTVLTAIVFLLPFVLFAVEAAREASSVLAYARQVEQSGIPVPTIVGHLPFAPSITNWWTTNLAHPNWATDLARRLDTASTRELGRHLGTGVVHRAILFGFCLLALFFLFRDGRTLRTQAVVVSTKLFGPRGERLGHQMIASVHGTVNGLVLVGLGEGLLLGIVYAFTGVPHPILLGAATAVAAMIPFAAALAIGIAACLAAAAGSYVGAGVIVGAGLIVTFTADHAVRPALIGGTTKLPFIWVLLGILGGVETFGLLGLFVGPAIMAALVLLWREIAEPASPDALAGAPQ